MQNMKYCGRIQQDNNISYQKTQFVEVLQTDHLRRPQLFFFLNDTTLPVGPAQINAGKCQLKAGEK